MRKQSRIALLGALLLGARVWGQQDPGQTTPPNEPAPATSPAPAFGQEPPPPQVTVAPPVTSLDEMSLEPTIAPRSYLQPGGHVTESINSNYGNSGSGIVGITRLLGSLDLTRIWSRNTLLLDYVGGASISRGGGTSSTSQIHGLAAAERYAWRTGQVQVNDCMSYLPEGAFGFSGFNGAGGGGVGGQASCGGFGGGGTYGSIRNPARLTNATSVDLRESLSPRSSITAAGNYTFTNFMGHLVPGTIDSRQTGAQVGYSHVLNHFDQVGVQYGYDHFEYPQIGLGSIDSQTVQALWEHAVSGRMDITLGVGPQFVKLPSTQPQRNRVSVSARGILRYKFPRSSLSLSYIRQTTAGSGIQLGSQTDVARGLFSKPLTRLWTGSLDGGYSHHDALITPPATGPGSNALGGNYQAGFGGGGLTRRIGRYFSLQMHYQYTYQFFSVAGVKSPDRHIGDITLSWHPNPIRLD